METIIRINIVTPNSKSIEGETDFVVCRLDEGEYGFLINHSPLIAECFSDRECCREVCRLSTGS